MSDEKGAVRKDPGGKLNVALVYPNTYFVGMSNLGLHTMYRVMNAHPGIVCERFFTDFERSVETSRPLQEFQIIAFSVSYELDWINMLQILQENSIPLLSRDRPAGPIVLAGGAAATINPEPVAEVLDVCFLGEGEPLADILHEAFSQSASRSEFLERLHKARGIYVPGLTTPVYEGETITGFEGKKPEISIDDPLESPGHSVIFTNRTVFADMFLTEIARGCPYRCKFCTARQIYSPFRPVEAENLKGVFEKASSSGKKLGLVSTSLNNHPQLSSILSEIDSMGLRIAPPSLRLGMIRDDLLHYLRKSGVNGVTLAPEAGSDSLRSSVGKVVTNEGILEDVTSLVQGGIRDIKLYFMVGIPGEEPEDIDAIIDLVKRIRQVFILVSKGNRRIGKVSVSINTMVPKPHSRYERESMIEPAEAKKRIRKVATSLGSQSNVSVNFEGPKWAYLQGMIARGDRRVLDVLVRMAGQPQSRWQGILKDWPRNPDYYALRQRCEDELLPWGFYSSPVVCRDEGVSG